MIPVEAERPRRTPVVTWTLIALNVAVFMVMTLGGPEFYDYVTREFGLIPYYVIHGERLYTLLTSMFIHAGLLHLLGNMMYLYVFGSGVEARLGKVRYLMLYFASGIVAGLTHIVIELVFAEPIVVYGPFMRPVAVIDPLTIPCVGASGAISGVLGAYLVLFPRGFVNVMTITLLGLPVIIPVPAVLFIGLWFLYQVWMGVLSLAVGLFSGVSFWAHIGGFIGGLLIALTSAPRRRRRVYYVGYWWYEVPVEW